MTVSVYRLTIAQLVKMLRNLDAWLDEAVAHAESVGFDANNYLDLRLAPDKFTFARQVQAACDTAKFAAARLTDRAAPSHPDTERTMAELKARVAATITYLESFSEDDFSGSMERMIQVPFGAGKVAAVGDIYFVEFAMPNFYFHVSMAYAILRANGVKLGKRVFLGPIDYKPV